MGTFFKWKDEYSVGIQKIDDQHKKLVEIINDFYTAFTENKTKEKMGDILNLLTDYTQYHFTTEEQYFIDSGYQETKEHVEEHEKFTKTVVGFVKDYQAGSSAVTYKLMSFLRNWLQNHILKEDKKYSEHLVKYLEFKKQKI